MEKGIGEKEPGHDRDDGNGETAAQRLFLLLLWQVS